MSRPLTATANLSQTDVGRFFGLSRQAVAQWSGCPKNGDGTYDLQAVIQWRESEHANKLALAKDSKATEKTATRERLNKAKACREELALARDLKLVVRRDEVTARWGQTLMTFRNILDGLPASVAPRLEGQTVPEISKILRCEINQAIETMRMTYERHDPPSPESSDTAQNVDTQSNEGSKS